MTTYKDAVGTNIGENALLGKTPTFFGWDTDPSVNVDRLTDGSIATAMTSGTHDFTGAGQYVYIDFDVANGIYIASGYGNVVCAAASAYVYVFGSGDRPSDYSIGAVSWWWNSQVVMVNTGVIRFGITADGAATMTPSINELFAVRLA